MERRQFLISAAAIGGGMALGTTDTFAKAKVPTKPVTPWAGGESRGTAFSAWMEIAADDTVTVHVPEPEIGNGAMTQVAMTISEELECDWANVRTVFASIQRNHLEKGVYAIGFQPFFGGHSTQQPRFNHALQLGASARERLKAAAAQRWGVPAIEVNASNSKLTHTASGRTLRFGEVAAEATKVELATEPSPKPSSQWRLIGKKSLPKLNIPEIANGTAVFGIDVKLPDMVHAALMQCPVHGGKLKNHKPESVMTMPGVRAVVVVDPVKTRGSAVKEQSTFGMGDCQAQHGVAV